MVISQTVCTRSIKQRFFDRKWHFVSDVNLARFVIAIAGLFSLGIAIYLLAGNASGTWDLFLTITGLFGVPVAGIFAAGIFTRAANGMSSLVGLVVSAIVTWIVDQTSTSPFIISCLSFIVAFVVAWIIGLLTPKFSKNVDGLTAKTINMEYQGK